MLYIPMGQKKDFNRQAGRTAYPYRVYRNAGWDKDLQLSFDDLRSGLLCGNVVIA